MDTLEEVVEEAIQRDCNLIVSFHPIIFSGLKSLTGKTYVERAIIKAIEHHIAIYSLHTALDNSFWGVNARICDQLALFERKILLPQPHTIEQLITYVPSEHAQALREKLFEAGGGNIGNYSHCSFNLQGVSTYQGNQHSHPTIGERGVFVQFNLGSMYYTGQGAHQDYAEAARWYRKAADQGYAEAQNNLGAMYGNGHGVHQDDAEAVKWYRQAAEQGHAEAQYNLGSMYHNGDGVREDYAEALRWYRQAAEQGNASAQHNLGVMYSNGQGVRRNDAEAFRWFRKAAEQGDADAQNILGDMYLRGFGVRQDLALAQEWFGKACQNGDQDGCDDYQRLKDDD